MADLEKDQIFIDYVVKALVDNPDKVELKRSIDDRGVLLELTVDPEDMGKIIGKGGATAKSIRTLLRVLGAKDEERYNLKIIEPEGSEHSPHKLATELDTNSDSIEEEKPVETNQEDVAEDSPEEEATDSRAADIKAKAREGIEDLDTDI